MRSFVDLVEISSLVSWNEGFCRAVNSSDVLSELVLKFIAFISELNVFDHVIDVGSTRSCSGLRFEAGIFLS